MRNRKPLIFLGAYFLAIFLWLLFCYRQVQKACLEAGHTVQSAFLEATPLWENEIAERAKNGYPFFGNKQEEANEGESGGEQEKVSEEGIEKDSGEADKNVAEAEKYGQGGAGAGDEMIRVVLLGNSGVYHESILLEAGGEKLEITPDSSYFAKTDIIRIGITGGANEAIEVCSLNRACGQPSYRGVLEIRREEQGLVLINEVPLEEYVKGVLPSEMPASYPLEALKAQAVCARTYAGMKQKEKAYPEYNAAVDDSTACQVYRNLESSEQCDIAVEQTAGEVLQKEDGSFVECYYYSTSCGREAQMSVWHGGETERPLLSKNEEEIREMNDTFFDFIREKAESDLESEEAFYRWEYKCDDANDDAIFNKCANRQAVNGRLVWAEQRENGLETGISAADLGGITDMRIVERQDGGVADCMEISCEKGNLYVWGEYNIRYVLGQGGEVKLQSGMAYQAKELMPSAFISLQSICNEKGNMVGYIVVGGGFGHGVGLSQNGAKHMALAGNSYREILGRYYGEQVFFKDINV